MEDFQDFTPIQVGGCVIRWGGTVADDTSPAARMRSFADAEHHIGEGGHETGIVGHYKYGRPAFQRAQSLKQAYLAFPIHIRRRFVEDEELRFGRQGPGNKYPPPLAT